MTKSFIIIAFTFAILLISCELENPEEGIRTSDVITLEFVGDSTASANNEDLIFLEASLGKQSDANKEITFTTDQGSFAGTDNQKTLKVTADGKSASATVVADNTVNENVVISAEVGGFVASKVAKFERAYPTDLTLQSDRVKIKTDRVEFGTLTVDLFSDIGDPSEETKIDLKTLSLDSASADLIKFIISSSGSASAEIKSLNENPGFVRVVAEVNNNGLITASDSLVIEFVP